MKSEILGYLNSLKNELTDITNYLYENPELSYKEFKSSKYLCDILHKHNFNIKESYMDIPTAFYAQIGSGHPKLCFICHYDALPPDGHVNGNNLSCAISVTAAISISKYINKLKGSIIVLGCPGEFNGGSSVTMAKQGCFDDIDLVMMINPNTITAESGSSCCVLPMDIMFYGNDSSCYLNNSCSSPLDSAIFVFNSLNLLLKDCNNEIKIDGTINSPRYASSLPNNSCELKIHIKSNCSKDSDKIESKIRLLVKSLSEFTDIKSEINLYQMPYMELRSNKPLSRIFSHNLKESGIISSSGIKDCINGLSLGTVSHFAPCIYPYVNICEDDSVQYGTAAFADATIKDYAINQGIKTASALAITALDVIEKPSILVEIKNDFYRASL